MEHEKKVTNNTIDSASTRQFDSCNYQFSLTTCSNSSTQPNCKLYETIQKIQATCRTMLLNDGLPLQASQLKR